MSFSIRPSSANLFMGHYDLEPSGPLPPRPSSAIPRVSSPLRNETPPSEEMEVDSPLTLDLSNSPIDDFSTLSIPFEQALTIHNVTRLILSNCGIETFSIDFSLFKSVQILDISDNLIDSIPESIGKCSTLQVFRASNNEIGDFPSSMASLTELTSIDLSHNELPNFSLEPTYILRERIFPNLFYLDLSHNEILYIESSIQRITSLKVLNIAHNQIQSIADLSQTQISTIDASHNSIKKIPVSFLQNPFLQFFYINKNPLSTLPTPLPTPQKREKELFIIIDSVQTFQFKEQIRQNCQLPGFPSFKVLL